MTSGKPGMALLDGRDAVEVQALAAGELVRAVDGADGAGQAVAAGTARRTPWPRRGRSGRAFFSSTCDVFLDAAEHAEFGLDADALGVGAVDDALGDGDVLLERIVGGVDHHRRVEAAVDALVAGLLVAVVEVDGEDGLGEDLVAGADDGLRASACRCRRARPWRSG